MTKKQPKKKKKLRIKVLGRILLFICLIASLVYYTTNLNIKNISIAGNNQIKDVTIIETLGIKDYPKIYKLNINKMESSLKKHPLIEQVNIKRNFLGKLSIEVKESRILFYYKYNKKYITSNNKSIDDNNEYYGCPTLVNFTPDTVFDELVKGLNKIDYNIVKMINEIEYTPYKGQDGTIIDNNLFTLLMNDQNTVKIDTVNIKNLNKYKTIFASLNMDKVKGVVYLDTIIENKLLFKSYASIEADQKKEEDKSKKK